MRIAASSTSVGEIAVVAHGTELTGASGHGEMATCHSFPCDVVAIPLIPAAVPNVPLHHCATPLSNLVAWAGHAFPATLKCPGCGGAFHHVDHRMTHIELRV